MRKYSISKTDVAQTRLIISSLSKVRDIVFFDIIVNFIIQKLKSNFPQKIYKLSKTN